jgi:hypothetical protein
MYAAWEQIGVGGAAKRSVVNEAIGQPKSPRHRPYRIPTNRWPETTVTVVSDLKRPYPPDFAQKASRAATVSGNRSH